MAQTLKFGNKVWAAKEDSVLAYNDINNNYKPLPFSFSRASIGTRVNKDGLIETMGQDIARIDYTDSADGVLLLEPTSTNLIPYSEDFSNAAWIKSNATVLADQVISPDGTLNADELQVTSSGGNIYDNVGGSGDGVFSVFAKYKDVQYIRLRSTGSYAFFDIKNGIVGSTINVVDSKIEKYPNGWYRCSVIGNNTNSLAQIFVSSDGVNVGTGNFYLWGAQFEALSYSTSYIPTSGSTVTRAVETCNNSGNSEVFNDSQGVLFANIAALADDGTFRNISINDDTTAQAIRVYYRNIDYKLTVLIGSSSGGSVTFDVPKSTQFLKIAIKYIVNNVEVYINGFLVGTISSVAMPTGLNQLDFDIDNQLPFYGKTKELGYYDAALTDLELETLTSYRNWVSMVNELNLNIIYNG